MEKTDIEEAARAFIVPLGYPADVQWERVFVGSNVDGVNTGSLKHLCFELARAAFNIPRAGIDRERQAINLLEQLEQGHSGQWAAVRVEGSGWEIVRPRSQEAIVEACATLKDTPHARD